MFPLRDDAEFPSDGTLLNPGVVCRVEVAREDEDEDTICGVWLRRNEDFEGDIAADLVKGPGISPTSGSRAALTDARGQSK
jgi:hypothetical protein